MREFNLEQALAGHPVCTRDGREVTQLVKFDCESDYCVFGVVKDSHVVCWFESGRYLESVESKTDLFMAPVKKTGWVARYKDTWVGGKIYPTELDAQTHEPDALSYHQIEWEE
jgi:hypothetical protein